MMREKGDVLGFLRNWRTPGELKTCLGVQEPEAYILQLEAEGYGIKSETKEMGLFQVICYRWDGTRRGIQHKNQ